MNNEQLDDMTKKMQLYFENISKEESEKMYEKLTHEKFNTRWFNKFVQLDESVRHDIIVKIIKKYSSNEYREREIFNCGCEPRETLFGMLYEYAKIYGDHVPDNLENEFIEDAWIIDNEFYISVTWGQGCVYNCHLIENQYIYESIMQYINEDVLLKNGFEKKRDFGIDYYRKDIGEVFVDVSHISNMVSRNWHVHVDNQDCDSIASADIQTIEHFNKLMDLMDLKYRL